MIYYMNKLKRFFVGIFTLAVLFTACDQREFDMPPLNEPTYSGVANLTLAQFKAKYAGSNVTQITDNDIISGIVVANDVSGNFYKEFTIMDSTAGLKIAINQGDLYTDFRIGQKVFIECKDLHIGKYGGYVQLGGPYNTGIGQMTWETAQLHIFKSGWPDPQNSLLIPKVVGMDVVASDVNHGKLITLENVYFVNGGKEVCAAAGADGSTQTLSKTLASSTFPGKTITVRLSSAADFANKTLPAGNGDLTGIVSVYNNTYQFTPRDSMDFAFVGFGAGYVSHGSGTKADPYFADWVLKQQTGGKTGWVKGYIVGAVASGVNASNPINGNEDINWKAPFMNNTLVIATDSLQKDWTKCVVINLPADSRLRDSLNLADHASNLGKVVGVNGTFGKILGAAGVTVASGAVSEFWVGKPSTGPVVTGGDGSKENPYSVAQAMLKQGEAGKWVTGYIVGYINTGTSPYVYTYSSGSIYSNIIIADNASSKTDADCLPVQLASGTAIRTAINVGDNPGNIGKKVSICGSLETYFSVPGLKAPTDYVLEGGSGGNTGGNTGTSILSEAFNNTLGGFTAVSVIGDQAWKASSYGVQISGFASSANNANEDWLISPAINLTSVTSAKLTFNHAINKGIVANMQTNHTLWFSTNYISGAPSTATWSQVTIPAYPTGADWTFVSSGDISLPASVYGNSNVRFAFKYLSSTSESATWEIKELVVSK